MHFYERNCALCKQAIISIYSNNKPFPVYCARCYWSDKWNPLSFGQEYDFTQTFFSQLQSLQNRVSRLAIINRNSENSEYTNVCERNKNCYMIIESSNNENCLYCYWIQKSKDLVDCSFCSECELCYECDNCNISYELHYSKNCTNCSQSKYLVNCSGVNNCLGCVNLVNKQYYILNQPYSPEDYQQYINNLDKDKFIKLFQELVIKQPRKYAEISKSENCIGNYIINAHNCQSAFHAHDSENCRYAYHVWRQAKDCLDVDTVGMQTELVYESTNTAINSYNCQFCARCWSVRDSQYCIDCDNAKNILGSISLIKAEYCILNKQYSRSDYQIMINKIKQDMIKNHEYGEFFPSNLSPFAYNETAAMLYYPLQSTEALMQQQNINIAAKNNEPICESCHKLFKYIKQEEVFYTNHAIALPKICFSCRLLHRLQQRNPNHLWHRQCMCTQPDHNHQGRCAEEFATTYSPEQKELVYCEQCYQKEIY